jgi:hypothetical protein
MTNNIRLRIYVVWFSVFLSFVAFLPVVYSFVLCLEDDGCIVLKTLSVSSNCGRPLNTVKLSTSCAPAIEGNNHTNAHCISCIDIPLSFDFLYQNIFSVQNKVPRAKFPLIASFSLVPSTFARMAARGLSLQPLIDNHSFLASIRSVILLI